MVTCHPAALLKGCYYISSISICWKACIHVLPGIRIHVGLVGLHVVSLADVHSLSMELSAYSSSSPRVGNSPSETVLHSKLNTYLSRFFMVARGHYQILVVCLPLHIHVYFYFVYRI